MKFEVDAEAASGVKSSLVVSKETDESMDVSMLEGEQVCATLQLWVCDQLTTCFEQTHASLRQAIKSRASPEAMLLANESSAALQETVYRLMRVIRPLSFA